MRKQKLREIQWPEIMPLVLVSSLSRTCAVYAIAASKKAGLPGDMDPEPEARWNQV